MVAGVLYWHRRRKSQPIMQGSTGFDGTLLTTAQPWKNG